MDIDKSKYVIRTLRGIADDLASIRIGQSSARSKWCDYSRRRLVQIADWIGDEMGVEDYITGNTREERRQGWNCCCVLHSGDGPETTPWVRIVGVYDITAEEAAEHYARERMGGVDCDEWDDGSVMYVAVDTSMERPCVYACQKELQARINVRFDTERVDLLHPTLTVTRRSDS